MINPLLVVKNGLEDSGEKVVEIPKENGFSRGITQKDIDAFFASLGYAEAQLMPLRRHEDGLYVCISPFYKNIEFYENIGFASADSLPYFFIEGNLFESNILIVSDLISHEAKLAGYAKAESSEKDDIPF